MIERIEEIGKNQIVIYTGKSKIFWSYNSLIAEWKNGSLQLGLDWNYSRTTMKYLHIFLKEYTNCKYTTRIEIEKAIKEKEIKINKNFKSIL